MRDFVPFPESALSHSIADRFQEIVSRFGNKCAIQTDTNSVSYRELLEQTYPITRLLVDQVAENTPVALLLPQGPLFISGMFGCLAAGVAYAPLDPSYPMDRLAIMLDVVRPPMIIACKQTESLARKLAGESVRVVLVEELKRSSSPPVRRARPENHAYILFTSGSTGRPKGVVEIQRNILHNVMRQTNTFHITPEDRQTLVYTCGVYGGARDIFCALLNGATLCHYDIETKGYTKLGEWIRENKITIYCSVATIFRYFGQYLRDPSDLRSVRIIKLGGEASRRSDVELFKLLFSNDSVFYTGLASTETGTVCQYPIRKDTLIHGELLPLGRPATGMNILLRGPDGKPVPQGEVGEILVESEYLSLGYFAQPEQTAQKFFEEGGKRYYRTGDLGRMDAGGCLWHCGRGDQQVKIRGNRIELGEVEAAFLKSEDVADALIAVAKTSDGENYLVGYLVPKAGRSIDAVSFRKFLLGFLPTFMVPSVIIPMKEFKRTVNGKIDRASLPDPAQAAATGAEGNKLDAWHSMVAGIWKRVLGLPSVGVEDNFFALGGHSLKLVQMLDEAERRIGTRIPLQEFLKSPTIANMTRIARETQSVNPNPMITYRLSESHDCLLMLPGILGLGLTYRLLNEELRIPWTVLAAQFCEEREEILRDIDALAMKIIQDAVQIVGRNRCFHLIGYSMGGFVAVKVIEKLLASSHELGTVILLDSDPPFCKPGTFKLVNPVMGPEPVDEKAGTLLAKSNRAMRTLKEVRHTWTPDYHYDGRVCLIQSSIEAQERQKAQREQWGALFPALEVKQVEASHVNFVNYPYVALVARRVEEILAAEVAASLNALPRAA